MKSTRYDRKVTFQSQSTTTDSAGEETPSWSDIGANPTVPAAKNERRGREIQRAGRFEGRQAVVWMVRYRTDLTTAMRLYTGGSEGSETGVHHIHGISEVGRREQLEITTTLEDA